MELTLASVLRSTSVSSSRRTMVPPLRRAYSQLKIKVRALPTCKKPVGDGANRTRSITSEYIGSGRQALGARRPAEPRNQPGPLKAESRKPKAQGLRPG